MPLSSRLFLSLASDPSA